MKSGKLSNANAYYRGLADQIRTYFLPGNHFTNKDVVFALDALKNNPSGMNHAAYVLSMLAEAGIVRRPANAPSRGHWEVVPPPEPPAPVLVKATPLPAAPDPPPEPSPSLIELMDSIRKTEREHMRQLNRAKDVIRGCQQKMRLYRHLPGYAETIQTCDRAIDTDFAEGD